MMIAIDPGHVEGYNHSPCGFGYAEGTRMYELSLLLAAEFERYVDKYGKKVSTINTRKNIKMSPSLYDRAAISKDADLLLSLHTNAASDKITNGTDYVCVFRSIKDKSAQLSENLAKAIASLMGTKQKPQAMSKLNDPGTADFYAIIRHAQYFGVRCLLLEQSFHTDTAATKWLMNDANLQRLAETIAATVAAEYKLTKIKEEKPEMRYMTMGDVKADKNNGAFYAKTLEKLIEKGIFNGKGGTGDARIIDLGEDAIRILVTLDRKGVFGG